MAALLLPGLALAAEKPPLTPDKEGVWHQATRFNETTTFSCPDRQPRTPRCAIELVFVCHARPTDELCLRVSPFYRKDPSPGWWQETDPKLLYRYRIHKVRFVTQEDIDRDNCNPVRCTQADGPMELTDLLVTVFDLQCRKGVCPRGHPVRRATTIGIRLRQIDGMWQWLGWSQRFFPLE